jgi:chaperonin GroES
MSKNFQPLADRVYIQRLELEEKSAGGIIIPDAAKDKGQTGKVLAIGAGKLDNNGRVLPMAVKAGDIVFFGKYAGTEIDKDHLVLPEGEILGIINN